MKINVFRRLNNLEAKSEGVERDLLDAHVRLKSHAKHLNKMTHGQFKE